MSKPLAIEVSSLAQSPPRSSLGCGGHFMQDQSGSIAPGGAANPNPRIGGAQIETARILLGWSQAQLSWRSGVSESTIWRIEKAALVPRKNTRAKIAFALRAAGIDFIGSVGVTLRPEQKIKI